MFLAFWRCQRKIVGGKERIGKTGKAKNYLQVRYPGQKYGEV